MTRSCMSVAIQRLPVRFAIDRSRLVGADGATHAGSYDNLLPYHLPLVVMAAADEAGCAIHVVPSLCASTTAPRAVRFRGGEGVGVDLPERGEVVLEHQARPPDPPRQTSVATILKLSAPF